MPTRLGNHDREPIAAGDLIQNFQERGAGVVGVVIYADYVDEAGGHQSVRRSELNLPYAR